MTWERWTGPLSSDEQVARRERLVNILAMGGVIAGLGYWLFLVVQYFVSGQSSWISVLGGGLCVGFGLVSYLLSRRGHVQPAAILIVIAAALIGLYSVYARGTLSMSVVVLAPATVFAGTAIGGWAAWITTFSELILYGALIYTQERGLFSPPIEHSPISAFALAAVSLLLLTLVTVQTLRVMDRALRHSKEREQALQVAGEEKRRLLEELQARQEAQQRLLETVRELGSPIIPLSEGVIAMPLIGAIDSERAQTLGGELLRGVAEHRAHTVLVDITGVPVVDTMVASALVRAMNGASLLGAQPVLTGIRAEVARTVVELELDLRGIITRATLQEGLEYALLGRQVNGPQSF